MPTSNVAVRKGVESCFNNSGQSCNAPTRMLVPRDRHGEALAVAKKSAEAHKVGDPKAEGTMLGPVVSEIQFNKIQRLIESGIKEGATLVTGGVGRPEGLNRGYYVRPTVFGDVRPGHDHRARGDLRPRAVDHALRQRGAGDRDRQRHGLRPLGQRGIEGHRARPPKSPAACAPVR